MSDDKIDRLIASVAQAIDDGTPLVDDWRVDARDTLTDLEVAIARVHHPDDRDRLVVMLSTFAGPVVPGRLPGRCVVGRGGVA